MAEKSVPPEVARKLLGQPIDIEMGNNLPSFYGGGDQYYLEFHAKDGQLFRVHFDSRALRTLSNMTSILESKLPSPKGGK